MSSKIKNKADFIEACRNGNASKVKRAISSIKLDHLYSDDSQAIELGLKAAAQNGQTRVVKALIQKFGRSYLGQLNYDDAIVLTLMARNATSSIDDIIDLKSKKKIRQCIDDGFLSYNPNLLALIFNSGRIQQHIEFSDVEKVVNKDDARALEVIIKSQVFKANQDFWVKKLLSVNLNSHKCRELILRNDNLRNGLDSDTKQELLNNLDSRATPSILEQFVKFDEVKENKNNEAAQLLEAVLSHHQDHAHIFKIYQDLKRYQKIQEVIESQPEKFLRLAVKYNHIDIVHSFLKINKVRTQIVNSSNVLLQVAVENQNSKMVKELLEIGNINHDYTAAIVNAVQRNDLKILNQLLDPDVLKRHEKWIDFSKLEKLTIKSDTIALKILELRISNGKVADNEMIRAVGLAAMDPDINHLKNLLKNDDVRASIQRNYDTYYQIFLDAIQNENVEAVSQFLLLKDIKSRIHENNNEALKLGAMIGNGEILNLLLNVKSVQRELMMSNDYGLLYFYKKYPIQAKLNQLEVFGVRLSILMKGANKEKQIEVLERFLEHPISYLEDAKFPKQIIAAVNILYRTHELEKHKKFITESERNRERFDNVDDEARIGTVRQHFNTIIRGHFLKEFEKFGATDKERVDNIESDIRRMILDEIKNEAEEKKNDVYAQEIIQFINSLSENEKNDLLKGDNEALMNKARGFFSSAESSAQTAWRAYDKFAPVGGEWPNLLTPPLEGEQRPVYTVRSVGIEAPTTQMASDISRQMMAYSYLLVSDKEDGDEQARATRQAAFIAKIAEIRRAHNDGSTGVDDPSCLPGTISRVGDTWIAHAKGVIPDAPQLLPEELRSIILEKFSQTPIEDQEQVYQSLVMLSSYNAKDIISGNTHEYSEQNLKIREEFLKELDDQNMFSIINQRLIERGSRPISLNEYYVYVPALIADIGGAWTVQQLTTLFRKSQTKDITEEVDNPYRAVLAAEPGVPIFQANMVLMRNLQSIALKDKPKLIQELAKCFAQGQSEQAYLKLRTLAPEKIDSIEKGINDILASIDMSKEITLKKAALWDKLNTKYKHHDIDNRAYTLKEVVEKHFEGEDLNAALRAFKLPVMELDTSSKARPKPVVHSLKRSGETQAPEQNDKKPLEHAPKRLR